MNALQWILVVLLLSSSPAWAQEDGSDEAKRLFQTATKLYGEGKYTEALSRLKAAYTLKEHPQLLYNIGLCQEKLNRAAEAVDSFRRYLEMSPNTPDRADVEMRIKILEARVMGEVKVVTDPPQAQVTVDGSPRCTSPCSLSLPAGEHTVAAERQGYGPASGRVKVAPQGLHDIKLVLKKSVSVDEFARLILAVDQEGARIMLDGVMMGLTPLGTALPMKPGSHKLQIEAVGYEPWSQSIQVAPGQAMEVRANLVPTSATISPMGIAAWSLVGLTGASLVVGAILGGLNLAATSELEDYAAGTQGWSAEQNDLLSSSEGYEAGAIALFCVAGASAVATTVLFLLDRPQDGESSLHVRSLGKGLALGLDF